MSTAFLLCTCPGAPGAEVFRYELKVVDTNGQPITGAIVERYGILHNPARPEAKLPLEETVTTGNDGLARFASTNRIALTLFARKPGFSFAWAQRFPQAEGEDSSGEIVLTGPTAVSGVVQDAAGKPVGEAAVWVNVAFRPGRQEPGPSWDLLNARLGRQYLATKTTADGKFRIESIPADARLALTADKPGLALDTASQPYLSPQLLSIEPGQSNIVLTLKPSGGLEGRVVEEGTGSPLAGARVQLADSNWGIETDPFALTGPDGVFRLANLSAGEHTLRTVVGTNHFSDWVCELCTASVAANATNRDVKITASRGAVLQVSVHAEHTDKPIADATVSASQGSLGESANTAEDGITRLRLVPGQYFVYFGKEGWGGEQSQVTLEKDQTNRMAITLKPATKLLGTVLSPDDKPAPNVSVLLFPHYGVGKRTDAQGRFSLTLNVNRFGGMSDAQLVLIARDLEHNLAAALDIEEDATNATLKLEPGLTLAGRVKDANGKAIGGASADLMFFTERMGSSLGATPIQADAEGKFEIKGLPRGRRFGVNVTAKGYGRSNKNLSAEETGKDRIELEPFQLTLANLRVAGVVLDGDDKPVAGVMVYGFGEDQPSLNGQTDAKGRFLFEQVCPGPIQLNANPQRGGAYGNASAEGGDTNVTIRLGVSQPAMMGRGGSKVSGTVLDAEGKPAPKVSVSGFPSYSPGERQTDSEGRFTLMSDPDRLNGMGSQRVVIARDLARNLAAALDLEEESTNADLRLEPGVIATGRVTDADGKPINNAQAQLLFRTDRMSSWLGSAVHVDSEGKFEIKALAPGQRYSVNVSAKGFGQESREIESLEAGAQRVELEAFQLPVADQRIAGVVVDNDDKPVARAWVHTYGDKQPNSSIQSDAKGRFVIDKVCAGTIRISASSPRGMFGNSTAEGGDTNIVIRISSSPGRRVAASQPAALKGKPLPDLAPLGFAAADVPANQPVLVVLIDAEQRPSRRALKTLGEQMTSIKTKGVAVIALHAGTMTEEDFSTWKQDSALPFPVASLKIDPEKARSSWGAGALPWLILTDKDHKVLAEGFALEELEAKLQELEK